MFLLATDYDGTFKSDIKNLYININVVNKFMASGNKFAIVTGRSFKSIKEEINKYNIKYDYLACNNGLIVFDNKDNIIYESTLSLDALKNIYEILLDSNAKKIRLYDYYDSTEEMNQILEIYAKFNSVLSAYKLKKYIEKTFQNIKCYRDSNKLFIGNDVSKATAVSFIGRIENIDKNNIYTVGDNLNDLEMLQEFNGYKMLYSYPNIWIKNIPITREVHTLVKKINRRA